MQSIQAAASPPDAGESFIGVLSFLTAPHYLTVLLRYSASLLVLFFFRRGVVADWQAQWGGKLLEVAIWILEAIPASIKMLTQAKSLVSLSYACDGKGERMQSQGDPAGWGCRPASRTNRAAVVWGMVVKS